MIKYILTALLLLSIGLPSSAQIFGYPEARDRAQEHEGRTPPDYMEKLVEFYKELAISTMPVCAEEVGINDAELISIVSKVEPDGTISNTWTMGASKLLPCLLEELKTRNFPAPPFQPYFSVLDMRGNPTKFDEKTKVTPAPAPPPS